MKKRKTSTVPASSGQALSRRTREGRDIRKIGNTRSLDCVRQGLTSLEMTAERVAEKTLGAGIDDAKRRGEWAEIRFMGRASAHGLQVNKPWGDSSSYDFVVGHKGRFVRVQVKSTKYQEQKGGYRCGLRGSANLYSDDAFDFLAAYVIPEDVWYIMPMERVRGRRCVSLYPNYGKSKMGVYKEAWGLLKARPGRVGRIEACAGWMGFCGAGLNLGAEAPQF